MSDSITVCCKCLPWFCGSICAIESHRLHRKRIRAGGSGLTYGLEPANNARFTSSMRMAVYTKHGQRITSEATRIDENCYFADKVIKIRAVPENRKKEQVYWVKDLLADSGKVEIDDFIAALKRND